MCSPRYSCAQYFGLTAKDRRRQKRPERGAVDMRRNIFHAGAPIPMIKPVSKGIYNLMPTYQAFEMYKDLKSEG